MPPQTGDPIRFEKWSGAGNDFLLLGESQLPPDCDPAALARKLCARGLGVGADGLILIAGESGRLWNPDGSVAEFCGNGARCLGAHLLRRSRAARVSFRLGEFTGQAWSEGQEIAVEVPTPRFLRRELDRSGFTVLGHHAGVLERAAWIDAGVPHLVLLFRGSPGWLVADADPVERIGAALRRASEFAPGGTNVDFLCPALAGEGAEWRLRTYERGVEGETLACGSGAVAAALLLLDEEEGSVRLRPRSGLPLQVHRKGRSWILQGPAQCVYRGELTEPI